MPGVRRTLDRSVGPPIVLNTTAPRLANSCHLPKVNALTPKMLPAVDNITRSQCGVETCHEACNRQTELAVSAHRLFYVSRSTLPGATAEDNYWCIAKEAGCDQVYNDFLSYIF